MTLTRILAIAAVFAVSALFAPAQAADGKTHRVAFHVDQNDPAVMNLVLNNVTNLMEYYHDKGEQVQIEVVAYGPGLHMLREDTSPVKARLASFTKSIPNVSFKACQNTIDGMSKRENKEIPIVANADRVPSGIITLIELSEKGWTIVRP